MRGDTTNLLIIRSIRNGNDISGLGWSRYSGFSSNNNKRSARNTRGWVSDDVSSVLNFRSVLRGRGRVGKSGLLASERSNVSSVRNGNGIRGSRGWVRGRAENSVRNGNGNNNNKLSA